MTIAKALEAEQSGISTITGKELYDERENDCDKEQMNSTEEKIATIEDLGCSLAGLALCGGKTVRVCHRLQSHVFHKAQ